jgi:DNA-binding transcriptional regulator YdaS (Cro superfamily)
MSKLVELVAYFGTQDKMADALEVTQGAVSQWIATGGLPARRAIEVERITKGRFKALDIVAPSESADLQK